MNITINNQQVTIVDKIKRKAMRLYREAIFSSMQYVKVNGDIVANDKVDPVKFDNAEEILICECVTHIEGVPTKVDREWLDNLFDEDYQKLKSAIDQLKNEHIESLEEGKKNLSEVENTTTN